MDNKKIGELIAKLRREKGLTQQSLGDLVGVGATAVSKWERGLTLPDIGIINELSQILGISSDELLDGEVKENLNTEDDTSNIKEVEEINETEETTTSKNKSKKILLILIPLIAVLIIVLLLIYNNNKTYAYNLLSVDDQYYVEGKAIFRGSNISIIINKIKFRDTKFSLAIIKNYEYDITVNDKYIAGYGYMDMFNNMEEEYTVKDFSEKFNINYNGPTNLLKNKIIQNNITITLRFLDSQDNEIIKKIEIALIPLKSQK